MELEQFAEKVRTGNLKLDEDYWVCNFVYQRIEGAASRDIAPMRVRISLKPGARPTSWLPYVIRSYGKTGALLTKTVPSYGNHGEYLHVFTNEQDCIGFYITQCEEVERQTTEALQNYTVKMNSRIESVKSRISSSEDRFKELSA